MTVNEAIEIVLNGINPEWSTLEKIRYVYVTIGKMLQKDTDFFFSVDNKLEEMNLSLEEIEKIYLDNKSTGDLRVICRSAAYILQRIYDRLGIKSELIKSNNNVIAVNFDNKELLVHHWFLAVYDEDGKAYFLTLASDLPYIQMGMQTKHFGNSISYKKVQKDGTEIQVYCGKEINHTVLSAEELRTIDLKIGYIRDYYQYDENYRRRKEWIPNYADASLAMLSNELSANKLYMNMEEQKTLFYAILSEFRVADRDIMLFKEPIESISPEEWQVWLKKLCKLIHRRIEKVIEYKIVVETYYDDTNWNYGDWLKDICVQIQRYLHRYLTKTHEELWVQGDFDYGKWSRNMRKTIEPLYDEIDLDNVLMMLDKTNVLAKSVLNTDFRKNFIKIFTSLSRHFINKDRILETSLNDGIVSSKYIAHKFRKLFTKIFSCNKEVTDLNMMEYSEQIVIIKMILDRMFPELNNQNAILDEFYNENYSPIQNRIQIYSIKHKQTGNYALIFHIVGDDTFGDTYYFYDPKANKFEIANILKIKFDYIIVSDRFKTRIEELEDIEDKKRNK